MNCFRHSEERSDVGIQLSAIGAICGSFSRLRETETATLFQRMRAAEVQQDAERPLPSPCPLPQAGEGYVSRLPRFYWIAASALPPRNDKRRMCE